MTTQFDQIQDYVLFQDGRFAASVLWALFYYHDCASENEDLWYFMDNGTTNSSIQDYMSAIDAIMFSISPTNIDKIYKTFPQILLNIVLAHFCFKMEINDEFLRALFKKANMKSLRERNIKLMKRWKDDEPWC